MEPGPCSELSRKTRGEESMATRLHWAAAMMAAAPWTVEAAGTAAGTVVLNSAEVSYHVGGEVASLVSNTVSFRVDEVLHVTVAAPADELLVGPGETARTVSFSVTNAGNGRERVALVLQTDPGGVDFIATPAAIPLYLDLDGNGALTAADVPYVPGGNEPELPADGSIGVIAVFDIPSLAADGQRAAVQLVAATLTGTGTPGSAYAGQGDAGVDAVVGLGGGLARGLAPLRASDGDLSVVKTLAVNGVPGATEAPAGARITYTLRVSPVGPVHATSTELLDTLPAGTTYVPDSMTIDGQPLTDADDGDAGTLLGSPSPAIRIALGNMSAANDSRIIEFSVLVN